MTSFDRYIGIDWSGASEVSKRPNLRIVECGLSGDPRPVYPEEVGQRSNIKNWKREEVIEYLNDVLSSNNRTLIGVDAAFGYPKGVGKQLFGVANWHKMVDQVGESAKNKVWSEALRELNERIGGVGSGPFYFGSTEDAVESSDGNRAPYSSSQFYVENDIPYYRLVENYVPQAISTFYAGAGAKVAAHTVTWLPILDALMKERDNGGTLDFGVWPHEEDWAQRQHVIVECYPALYTDSSFDSVDDAEAQFSNSDELDAARVACWLHEKAASYLTSFPQLTGAAMERVREEGWILGVGVPASCTA